MPTPKRRHQSSLIRHLIEQPQRFQFFQAVRVLDLWLRRGAYAHGQTLDTVLRFKNSVSLSFPPSQIEALTVEAEVPVGSDSALQAALERRQLHHIHLTPAFMGFLGVSGVLPYDYTNSIAAQIHYDKDESGRAFFDCFSHRLMTLFYRAWEKCRVEYRLDDQGRDGFLPLQLALAGKHPVRAGSATARPAVDPPPETIPAEVAARYAALIRHRPLPTDAIAGVLSEYFCLPFRLQALVGAWETQQPQERSRLGGQHRRLGHNVMLGPRYWRRDLCVRLWVGPLARADFDRFLASGSGGKALAAVLALFAVPTIRFEVRLLLRARDVKPAVLNSRSRLGQGAFLLSKPQHADQMQTRYYIKF